MRYEIEVTLGCISIARAMWFAAAVAGWVTDPGVLTERVLILPLGWWALGMAIAGLLMLAMLRWAWLDDLALSFMFCVWGTQTVLYLINAPWSPTTGLVAGYAGLAGLLSVWHWLRQPPTMRAARRT